MATAAVAVPRGDVSADLNYYQAPADDSAPYNNIDPALPLPEPSAVGKSSRRVFLRLIVGVTSPSLAPDSVVSLRAPFLLRFVSRWRQHASRYHTAEAQSCRHRQLFVHCSAVWHAWCQSRETPQQGLSAERRVCLALLSDRVSHLS